MPSVGRLGADSAGGTILTGNPSVLVNGLQVAVIGSSVDGHGDSPHSSPRMTSGSQSVVAGGIGICRTGDNASCGHSLISGSNVEAG
jgi:uncharacterized Zn-binding protein involved in type VI secretion